MFQLFQRTTRDMVTQYCTLVCCQGVLQRLWWFNATDSRDLRSHEMFAAYTDNLNAKEAARTEFYARCCILRSSIASLAL